MEIDPTKLLFIAVAALVLLGPERLPEVARRAGTLWSQIKGHRDRLTQQIGQIPGLPTTAVSQFLSESLDPTHQLRSVIGQVRGPIDGLRAPQRVPGSFPAVHADLPPGIAVQSSSSQKEQPGRSWLPSGFTAGSPDLN